MNCEKCVSKKMCFVQEQIKNLARRITSGPFFDISDVNSERTLSFGKRCEKRMVKEYDVHYKLMGVIASNCPFYISRALKRKEETYKIETLCTNCGAGNAAGGSAGSFEIPKSQWVDNFLGPKVCEKCDCRGCLKRK